MSVISKTISNSSNSTTDHPLWSAAHTQSHSRLNSFSQDKDPNASASLIFERNVEDPLFLSQGSRPVSRPVSRAISRSVSRNASRPLSRKPSQATIATLSNTNNNGGGTVTNYTSANIIHKPLPTKRNSSFSFSSPSTDLRRYNTNPNNNNNNNNINSVTSSQIRRVNTGNPQLYSPSFPGNTSFNNNNYSNYNGGTGTPTQSNDNYLHSLENFVPPALDESCSIVTDVNTKLGDVDMIYSKRPSTLGLDMALGRTRSSSFATPRAQSTHDLGLQSNPSTRQTSDEFPSSSPSPPSRLLRFYSYADMLSDENIQQQQQQYQQQIQGQNSSSNSTMHPNQHRPDLLNHNSYSNDDKFDDRKEAGFGTERSTVPRISPSPPMTDTPSSLSASSFFINPFTRTKKEQQQQHEADATKNKKNSLRRHKSPGTLQTLRSKFHLHSDSSGSQDECDDNECDDNECENGPQSRQKSIREKSPKSVGNIGLSSGPNSTSTTGSDPLKEDDLYPDGDVATISDKNGIVNDYNYEDSGDERLQKERVTDILRRRVTETKSPTTQSYGHGYLDRGTDRSTATSPIEQNQH
ncbi:Vhs2p KABA2_02S15224 [Maudiozyma barnettii]|uniref:Uncharacterized protein n=1 Tax=Maudiozyma barnettii TaxID=61262 RepID=A0A8H2ZIP5_9SACH|nr:Vhs2p [Kazachstania barnettii]CAB4253254.1 some similarities with Saccharomyces cerevisiae YIL135C VHS2 Cytoplasmic protein of unknown function [Kazachstania barnettii]